MLKRRHDRNEEIYRNWCEETHGMIALGEEVFHLADIFDRLAVRIGLTESFLRQTDELKISTQLSKILPLDVLDEIRRLNSIRNGFSHEATRSDKQAEKLIEEAYPSVRELLLDLRGLQDVILFRVKSVKPTAANPSAEVERLSLLRHSSA